MNRLSLLAALAALIVSGCGGTKACRDHTVRVTVDYAAASGATNLAIDATLTGAAPRHGSFAKPGGTSGSAEIDLGSAYVTGALLTVDVRALDGSGNVVASGSQAVTLAAGCTANVTITLTAVTVGPTAVTITPPSAALKPGAKQTFSANVPVSWSVMEAGGGSIDSSGIYTAPSASGTYTVVAVSQADATQKATATVTVAPFVLELLAGHLGGAGNVDGTGLTARFDGVAGITGDRNDALYVSETSNCTVRKIDIPTGTTSLIAGTPGSCDTIDNTGAQARFSSPGSIVSDGFQKLYVLETNTYVVRQVDAVSHQVATIAGSKGSFGFTDGTGSGARFNTPIGITFDSVYGLWVGDFGNRAVRRVALPGYVVTTLRDTSNNPVLFTQPDYPAFDGSAPATPKIYLHFNTVNFDVITTSQAAVTTMSGSPTTLPGQITLVNGMVLDGGGNIFASATNVSGGPFVRQMVISTGAVSTLAGGATDPADGTGAAAGFMGPQRIFYDGKGNVYVADGHAVRKIDTSTRAVTTIAGSITIGTVTNDVGAKAGFTGAGPIVYDGVGAFYIGNQDAGGNAIRKLDLASGAVTSFAGGKGGNASPFMNIVGLARDSAGNLYVNDYFNGDNSYNRVMLVTPAGDASVALDGSGGGHRMFGMTVDNSGNVYFTEKDAIWKAALVNGTGTFPTAPIAGVASSPGKTDSKDGTALFSDGIGALVWDGASALYVADGGAIRKVVLNGDGTTTVSTVAGTSDALGSADGNGAAARFYAIRALALNGAGLLYVVDGSTVRRVDVASGDVSTWLGKPNLTGVQLGARPANLNAPGGIASLGGDDLVLTDEYAVLRSH